MELDFSQMALDVNHHGYLLVTHLSMCNDRTFRVGRFRGHGAAGIYIIVLGHSCRMIGCLGNLVLGLPRRQW